MGIAEILQQINDAESEADSIIAGAKAQIAEIDKDTVNKIDRINADIDTEIAAKIKDMAPAAAVSQTVKVNVAQEKIASAVAYATKEFYARYGV
jgi:G3E family GTPase